MSVLKKKLVAVGDGGIGKTSLLMMYKDGRFPKEHIPTIFENYEVEDIVVDGKVVSLSLWDTAGQECYDRIRTLSYPDTDVFLVCFSVVDPDSFDNIETMWIPEIKGYCTNPNILLVGTKSDLRDDVETKNKLLQKGHKAVSEKKALKYAKSIKAYKYVECSAFTDTNIQKVFEEAIRSTLDSGKTIHKHRCTLL